MLHADDRGGVAQRVCASGQQLGAHAVSAAVWLWRQRRLRGLRVALRRVCGSASSPWLSVTGARRRWSASMDFIEQFRHGPETQSEWNLLLWRVTFPMIALLIFTMLAVLGKFGHRIYSFLVCPVWYFSHFVLVAHPFLLVFKFNEADGVIRKRIWQVLAALSLAISAMEWFLSSPPDAGNAASRIGSSTTLTASIRARFLRHSWIVANTVFGVVALVAIPRYFYLQKRMVAQDTYDSLAATSMTALFIPLSPAAAASRSNDDAFPDDPATPTSSSSNAQAASTTPPGSARGGSSGRPYSSILVTSASASSASFAALRRRSRSLLLLTACCAVLVWIVMFSSYSSIKAVEIVSKYWFAIYLLSPVACALLIYVLRHQPLSSTVSSSNSSSSFDFVALYSVFIVHLPVFLGHLCFRLFTLVELADPAHPAHAEARGIDYASTTSGSGSGFRFSASTSWMKLGISVVYLLVMQTFFYAMTQVVNAMAEPFAHPSLLYLGQLYYYLFWYVLVGSDTPIDALYWGMLLVNNVHIAFLNTGIYADVKQSSSSCFSGSILTSNLKMFRGSSLALCFRATTMTMMNVSAKSAAASRADASLKKSGEDRVDFDSNCTSGTEDDDTVLVTMSDTEEAESGSAAVKRASRRHHTGSTPKSDEEDAEADDPDQKLLRRSPSKRSTSWSAVMTPRSLMSFGNGAPSAVSTGAASVSATIFFTQCTCARKCASDVGGAACTCSQKHQGPSLKCTDGNQKTPQSAAVIKSTNTLEHLRPLYFLMKLAEQDNMADTTALILVPSLLTLLAVLDKPSHGFAIVVDQMNLWLRCICMFAGRLAGAYLAREIFTYKLRSRLRQHSRRRNRAAEESLTGSVEGVSTRMWIQRLMLQDFHRHFWYLTVVTIVVTFACFERMEVPARFALLT